MLVITGNSVSMNEAVRVLPVVFHGQFDIDILISQLLASEENDMPVADS